MVWGRYARLLWKMQVRLDKNGILPSSTGAALPLLAVQVPVSIFAIIAIFLCVQEGRGCVGLRSSGFDGSDSDEVALRLADDWVHSIKKFRELRLGMLEVEVLARLVDGRRTVNELVLEIYGTWKDRSGFVADYNRVRRALKNLERRGLVSAPLLSKEKLYRLTQYGVASLTRIGGTQWSNPRIIPVKDRVLYVCSIALAVAAVIVSRGEILPDPMHSYLAGVFLISVGGSLVRMLETLRRVF